VGKSAFAKTFDIGIIGALCIIEQRRGQLSKQLKMGVLGHRHVLKSREDSARYVIQELKNMHVKILCFLLTNAKCEASHPFVMRKMVLSMIN